MFVRFNTPKALGSISARTACRPSSAAKTGRGSFYPDLSILVAEDDDEVRLVLSGRPEVGDL